MTILHYLAYGSNLHPIRLAERVPSARVIDVIPMSGRKISFHKRSVDGSGKCLIYETGSPMDVTYGVLYEFDAAEKGGLDAVEGRGKGYVEQVVRFSHGASAFMPYIYMASASHIDPSLAPYHWYKKIVVTGARYHGFPEEYVSALEAVPSITDYDAERTLEHERLFERMRLT